MTPVIFPHDATEFTTQGWGTLNCISCLVTEERNGIYELEARIPLSSPRFDKIVEGNIIVATHSNKGDRQPFQIYSVSRAIDGIVDVRAEHISYRLNKNVVMPYTANNLTSAVSQIASHTVDPCAFTFQTDKTSGVKFNLKEPKSVKSLLYGEQGSLIDTYSSGDYEFDVFKVIFWEDRGEDNGIIARYGKNLIDILKETDISDIYTAIVPYWKGTDEDDNEKIVMLSTSPAAAVVKSDYVDAFPMPRTVPVDLSDKFEEEPTVSQLRSAAKTYVNENVRRQLYTTIRASFLELSKTDQYKDVYAYEKVNLCDTVTVIYEALGVEDKLKVSRIVYNVLADRNEDVTLGDLKKTLANMFNNGASIRNTYARKTEIIKNYSSLTNIPTINGVAVTGNITTEQLGIKDGKDGQNGKDGKSAYEVAVENGYTGTEEDWIKSLSGTSKETYTVRNAKYISNIEPFSNNEFLVVRVGDLFFTQLNCYIKSSTTQSSASEYRVIVEGIAPDELIAYYSGFCLWNGYAHFYDENGNKHFRAASVGFSPSDKQIYFAVDLTNIDSFRTQSQMIIHIMFTFSQ